MANPRLVSNWYDADNLGELFGLLSVGDLLEFDRRTYKHWGVCVAIGIEPHIVHRTGDSSTIHSCSNSLNKASAGIGLIVMESLSEVLCDNRVRINNYSDRAKTPKSVPKILYNAITAIDNDKFGTYNVLLNNCEHFANWCRYGVNTSKQSETTFWATAFGVLSIVAGVALRLLR